MLMGQSKKECEENIMETIKLLRKLGFIIHPSKSVLSPSKSLQYLGMIINTESMTIKLTDERIHSLVTSCNMALGTKKVTIRMVAQIIGKIVASFPAVTYGPLHYRALEEDKKHALRENRFDFDSFMCLSPDSKIELQWWLDNVASSYKDIIVKDPEIIVYSDASLIGWGCECQGVKSGGQRLPHENIFHINYLELKAASFALQCFVQQCANKHVRLMSDNMTTVACINKMGTSHSYSCNAITKQIWDWCIMHNIWLSAAHIPGVDNTDADGESRKINMDAEWQINPGVLKDVFDSFQFCPSIDLFASRINKQLERFASFWPDPEASIIDAFSVSWHNESFYAFPPFSIIARVLQKVVRDKAKGVIIVPDWPTQPWFPFLLKLLACPPRHLGSSLTLLQLPSDPRQTHRLLKTKRLKLLACMISANR